MVDANRLRTCDLSGANRVLSQLSYAPTLGWDTRFELVSPGPRPGVLPLDESHHQTWSWRRESDSLPSVHKTDAVLSASPANLRARPAPADIAPSFGANGRNRTCDLSLTKGVLCQLSYEGT